MQKYYIDTSIWIDYLENRTDKLRPLGEWAFELFRMIKENKDLVLYSEFVEIELRKVCDLQDIKEAFGFFDEAGLLIKVEYGEEQTLEAETIAREKKVAPFDAIHAVLARDNGAVLVTRDRHFIKLSGIVKIKKPEEII